MVGVRLSSTRSDVADNRLATGRVAASISGRPRLVKFEERGRNREPGRIDGCEMRPEGATNSDEGGADPFPDTGSRVGTKRARPFRHAGRIWGLRPGARHRPRRVALGCDSRKPRQYDPDRCVRPRRICRHPRLADQAAPCDAGRRHALLCVAYTLLSYWLLIVMLGAVSGISVISSTVVPFPVRALSLANIVENAIRLRRIIAALAYRGAGSSTRGEFVVVADGEDDNWPGFSATSFEATRIQLDRGQLDCEYIAGRGRLCRRS